MKTSQVEYRLIPFGGRRPTDPEFIQALAIYAEFTPVSERIDSSEIVYWHERYDAEFAPDRLLLFGLAINSDIVGFAEVVWLEKSKIAILDYMTISDRYNRNSAFFNFIDLIATFLVSNHMIYAYLATEILYEADGSGPGEESDLWIKLLRIQGFRSVHAPYFQPPFGTQRIETARRGHLMVLLRERSSQMKRETYLWIVSAIYQQHYERWYSAFGSDASPYSAALSGYLETISDELSDRSILEMNGATSVLPATGSHNSSVVPQAEREFTTYSVAAVLTIATGITALSLLSGASLVTTIMTILVSLIVYMVILSIFMPNTMAIVERLMEFVKSAFGRQL